MKKYATLFFIQISFIAILTSLPVMGIYFPEFLPRSVHRLLHIAGAILFFGNIIVSALWFTMASFERDEKLFSFGAKLINITDLLFTGPGLILLLLNGGILSSTYGNLMQVSWLKWAFIWFAISGFLWTFILIPLQLRFVAQIEKKIFPWSNVTEKKFMTLYAIIGNSTVIFVSISLTYMVLK